MLKRMEYFFIALLFVLVTAIILIVYTMEREDEFKTNNSYNQKTAVHGAAYAINLQLQNKHRHVHLFLDEYAKLISRLDRFPSDEETSDIISRGLQQRFSDFFTYTITDINGEPALMDIESLVGEACQLDLKSFASKIKNNYRKVQNDVFVHPQPFNYHYDIMAPMKTNARDARIFFTSFYFDEITDILKTHEISGQNLFLVRQSDPALIEVSREGARDKLSRDINLTMEEQVRITAYENIPGSDWRLVSLPDEDFEKQYMYRLWKDVIVVLLILTLSLFLIIFVLTKSSERKTSD